MRKFNSLGRSYISGKPLSGENRELIVNEIVRLGGDYITGDFEGNFSDVGRLFEVSGQTATNIWIRLTQDGTIKPKDKLGAFTPTKSQHEELELIEVLKHHKPSTPYKELKRTVERNCDIPGAGTTSKSALSRCLQSRMLDGKSWSCWMESRGLISHQIN